ncbi:GGDEF domain-containing protein [Marinobacteraceae bacterium S3BR75-40.1]
MQEISFLASQAAKALNPWNLHFRSSDREQAFLAIYNSYILNQSRIGLVLVIAVFLGMGLTDWLFFEKGFMALWTIRLSEAALMAGVLYLSFRPGFFNRYGQGLLCAVALIATLGIVGLTMLGSEEARKAYFAGMLLVVVWSYVTSGLRFVYAVMVNAAVIVLTFLACTTIAALPFNWLFVHGTLLGGVSVVAGSACYIIERQRRLLYLYTHNLDRERRHYQQSASIDHLTGLPNRRHFEQQLEQTLAEAQGRNDEFALLFLDINRFKPINDQHGHQVGDEVLQVIAERLENNVRRDDLVARLAGDEFVVLLTGRNHVAATATVARKLAAQVADPIKLTVRHKELSLRVTTSIGVACFPGDGRDAAQLIRMADQAMYVAKAAGESCVRYARDLHTQLAS